jgi:hypothetical protein
MFAHPRNRDSSGEQWLHFFKRSDPHAAEGFTRLTFGASSRALHVMVPSFMAILFLVGPMRAEETLYSAAGSNNSLGLHGLSIVDPTTAATTFVDQIHTPDSQPVLVTGIAFDPLNSLLYGVTTDGRLVTIDPGTAVATVIGNLGLALTDISFRSDGTLFGFEANNPFSLATINLSTGAATTVGRSGLANTLGGGLAFSPTDTLYLSATGDGGTLDTLNPATGARTIGPALTNGPILNGAMSAIAFNSLGTLFAVDSQGSYQDLVTINTATGAITGDCTFPDETAAIAFSPKALTTTDNQSDVNPALRTFSTLPHATKIKASVDFEDSSPGNVVVMLSALSPPDPDTGITPPPVVLSTLWDHEQLVDENNQPLTHIHAVVNNVPSSDTPTNFGLGNFCGSGPPVYSYQLLVFDDNCQANPAAPIGTGRLNSLSLTLDPIDPGHIGPPIVNLYAGFLNQPVPQTINSGSPLTLVARAVGNPSSYSIDRLEITIKENSGHSDLDDDPFTHQSGNTPEVYNPPGIHPAPSSSGATLSYTPPSLPPGVYSIAAIAYDSAGFVQNLVKTLTVNRRFGLFSVSNVSRTVNSDCPETNSDCNSDVIGTYAFPCNTTNFGATLTLINDTCTDSTNLRVRILAVPGSEYVQSLCPPNLPEETDLTEQNPPQASVSLVSPLPAHSCEPVQISGVVPKPDQTSCDFGIGFQIYAALDECIGGDCGTSGSGEWVQVDSIKVTEGEWPVVGGFNGPGGGVNNMRHGRKAKNAPLIFNSITINGPDTVPASAIQQYTATVTAKNAITSVSKDVTAAPRTRWSASEFTVPVGVFQPGHVSAATQVTLSASYTLGNITKTGTKTVTVIPTASSASALVTAMNIAESWTNIGQESRAIEATSSADQETGAIANKKRKRAKPKPKGKKSKAPIVTLSASPTCINEGDFASFTISASSINPSRPITVRYSLGGTANFGADYTLSGTTGQAVIPPGASSVVVFLDALNNDAPPSVATVTMTLGAGAGYKLPKSPTGKAATLTIDNSAPTCN